MQCKDCTHNNVCMHKNEYSELAGKLPVTQYPFKTAVTCNYYRQETGNIRSTNYELNKSR